MHMIKCYDYSSKIPTQKIEYINVRIGTIAHLLTAQYIYIYHTYVTHNVLVV